MKLILTTDVPGLGAPGEIVEVKDGYGRNFLLPQGKAVSPPRAQRSRSRRSTGRRLLGRSAAPITPGRSRTRWRSCR